MQNFLAEVSAQLNHMKINNEITSYGIKANGIDFSMSKLFYFGNPTKAADYIDFELHY